MPFVPKIFRKDLDWDNLFLLRRNIDELPKDNLQHGEKVIGTKFYISFDDKTPYAFYEGEFVFNKNTSQLIVEGRGIEMLCGYYSGYQGDWVDGRKHGNGRLYSSGFIKYIGGFKFGDYEGKGILYCAGEMIYKGDFVNGLYHGQGKKFEEQDQSSRAQDRGCLVYEGSFKYGKYEGVGKQYYRNGVVKYKGSFVDSYYHGKGILYHENGIISCRGEFVEGKLNGECTFYYANGKMKTTAIYKDDKCLEK